MKRLLIAFVVLVGIAIAAAVAGIVVAGKGRPLGGGSTVLVWRIDHPVVEQEVESALPFGGRSGTASGCTVRVTGGARGTRWGNPSTST